MRVFLIALLAAISYAQTEKAHQVRISILRQIQKYVTFNQKVSCIFDVQKYGAKPDNRTNNVHPIQRALLEASEAECTNRVLLFSQNSSSFNVYLTHPIVIQNMFDITIFIDMGVTLAPFLFNHSIWNWPFQEPRACSICFQTFLSISNSANVNFLGNGVIDGRGLSWWQQRWHNKTFNSKLHPPYMMQVRNVTGFGFHEATIVDPPAQFVALAFSSQIHMSHFKFIASWVKGFCPHPAKGLPNAENEGLCEPQNSDGIDISLGTHNVYIHDAFIQNGDDTVTVKCGYWPKRDKNSCTRNVVVENMHYKFGYGSNIGINPNGGCARNITFKNITMKDMAGAGAVIKTENLTDPNSFIVDVLWQDIHINGSRNSQEGCVGVTSIYQGGDKFKGPYTATIANITWMRVQAMRCNLPGMLWCPSYHPCLNLTFDEVRVSQDSPRNFSCICKANEKVNGLPCGPTTSGFAHGQSFDSDAALNQCILPETNQTINTKHRSSFKDKLVHYISYSFSFFMTALKF